MQAITGNLVIDNNSLIQNLNGLENLTSIGGDLLFNSNDNLADFSALTNLQNIGGDLVLVGLPLLTDLNPFSNITSLNSLVILYTDMLTTLDGLQNLSSVDFIFLGDNQILSDISALANIPTFLSWIRIENNPVLTNLDVFGHVTEVELFEILQNESIENVNALTNLQSSLEFIIYDNNSLTDISGISTLLNSSAPLEITVTSNQILNDCCVLSPYLDASNISFNIAENAFPCDSENSVVLSCGGEVCSGDYIFMSQAELDIFTPCPNFDGNITIEGEDITDLSALAPLQTITGSLEIDNCPILTTLNGLENFTSAGANLYLINNDNLADISALNNLQAVGEEMAIVYNTFLTDLSPLSNLASVTNLILLDIPVTTLTGLENLTSVAFIFISNNPQLTDISALSNVPTFLTGLNIEFNPVLTNIDAFSHVTTISDGTYILGNDLLENVDGLSSVQIFHNGLTIAGNNSLTNIDGLSSITNSTGGISIQYNSLLSDCCGIFPYLVSSGINISTEFNDTGCNTQQEILNACASNSDVDLELAISVDNDLLTIYNSYVYTLSLTNMSDAIASNIVVDFDVPAGMAFSGSMTDDPYLLSNYNDWIGEWSVQAILPGQTIEIEITLFSLTESVNITTYGQVVSVGQSDIDSTPNNGTFPIATEDDEAVLTISPEGMAGQEVDIELSISASATSITLNDLIDITVTVTNAGPDNASSVRVMVPLTQGLIYQQYSSTAGSLTGNNNWFVGELQSGISETLNLTFEVTDVDQIINFYGQVAEGIPNDVDSTPNNGSCCTPNEDDEAVVTFTPTIMDTTPPTVVLATGNTNVNGPFNVNINFSENINGLSVSDFDITNATVGTISGSGSGYSITVNPTNAGDVTVSLPADSVEDAAGNQNEASNTLTVNFTPLTGGDGIDLELSMSADVLEPAIYSNVTFNLTLSNTGSETAENIIVEFPFTDDLAYVSEIVGAGGFDIFLRRWTIPSLASGATVNLELVLFTLTEGIPITAYAQVTSANLTDDDSTPDNFVCNPAGIAGCPPNEDDEAAVTLFAVEVTGPSVILSTGSSSVTSSFEVNVDFSEAVTGLSITDFSVTNGTANNLSGSSQNYTITVTPIAEGNVSITLGADKVVNTNNEGNTSSNVLMVDFSNATGDFIDLELTLEVDDPNYVIYDYVSYTLTLTNTGNLNATNVVVDFPKPENFPYADHTTLKGIYQEYNGEWTIGNMTAGETATLELTLFSLIGDIPVTAFAQVQSAGQNDADSSPNNGIAPTPNEDDEAAVTITPVNNFNRAESNALFNIQLDQNKSLEVHNIYPLPADSEVNIVISASEVMTTPFKLYNSNSRLIRNGTMYLEEGFNTFQYNIENLSAGIYYLIVDTPYRHKPIQIIKQRL